MKRPDTPNDRAQVGATILDIVFLGLGLFLIGIFAVLNGLILDPVAEAIIANAPSNFGSYGGAGMINLWYTTIVKYAPLLAGLILISITILRAWIRSRRTAAVGARPPR
jgi:hypothetical protein